LWARLQGQPDYQALTSRFEEFHRTYSDYRRIFIAGAKCGRILASTDKADLGTIVAGQPFFTQLARAGGDFVGDVSLVGKDQEPVFHLARAMLSPQGVTVAMIVMEIKVEVVLTPLLHTGEGLGTRGEAILIDREGRILASLKHPLSDGRRPKPLQYRLQSQATDLALRGERGVVESLDYRGVPVLAAYRFIQLTPELGWGLVVKRDRDELLAPLRGEMVRAAMLGLGGIAVILLTAVVVARRVARPVLALARAAEQVARGDLSVRAEVTTKDEVGALARTFNDMVRRIQDWQEAMVRQERLAALGQVTATVSHELRNPLSAIRISFFVIAQRLRGKEPGLQPALDRIEESITRCEAIIGDLLAFNRNRPMERQPTELDPWLASLLDEYEPPPHVVLQRQLAAAATLSLDRERFRRCMLNVLNNACQAMEGPAGRLTVASNVESGRIAIRVSDTGCGIPADQLEKVFEPLFSTKSFGVGLGLPIITQIMAGHGGSVEVQSQSGQGTTFTLWLPINPNRETEGLRG
jgi:signal transduction histidine kinase